MFTTERNFIMDGIKVFENVEFGAVRTMNINGEPWFVGKDVAEILGYNEPRSAVSKKVDAEDKGVAKMDTPSGKQEMTIINESGLYSLLFSMQLQNANGNGMSDVYPTHNESC